MSGRLNKTSICSVLFLDIIDFSKKSDADQIEVKTQFNELISLGLKDVAQNDRIILDTGDGVAVAHMGSPEEAMFVALTIRDGILHKNLTQSPPLLVRFGINLGPVRLVSDINGQPNILGDGINVAERIMSFAEPNQILVSRSYFEVTSRLTQEFSEMFAFSGLKQDKHIRKHEVYAVRSHKTKSAEIIELPAPKDQRQSFIRMSLLKNLRWQYAMLCLPVIVAFVYLVKMANSPTQAISNPIAPNNIALESTLIKAPASLSTPIISYKNQDKTNHSLMPNETLETVPLKKVTSLALLDNKQLDEKNLNKKGLENKDEVIEKNAESKPETTDALKEKPVNKIARKKSQTKVQALAETDPVQTYVQHKVVEAKPVVTKTHTSVQAQQGEVNAENTQPKTGWKTFTDSVKQGHERKCSQVEITMNQCH